MIRLGYRCFFYIIFLFTAIYFAILFVFIDIPSYNYNSDDAFIFWEKNVKNETRSKNIYFESEESARLRSVQEKLFLYGVNLKRRGGDYFNKREGYNESLVDSIPIIRDINNYAPHGCTNHTYVPSSSKVSILINYHNEIPSLLLRTIYSVLRHTPEHQLKELVLIDDGSDLGVYPGLKQVTEIVASFTISVQRYRFEKAKGLIYCRRFGAQKATGDVILVLDSHCEVGPGYLPPLLNITDYNYRSIAAPIFDFWDTFTDQISNYDGLSLGFDVHILWNFIFVEKNQYPFRTAAIMGGAFLATKRWLHEVQYFGEGMVGWGGENIEICLKSWYCGGEVYLVPCSRVLHVAATRNPNNHGDRPQAVHPLYNNLVLAKGYFEENDLTEFLKNVQLDPEEGLEYAVQRNKEVMKNLTCTRNFRWLQDNLMPIMDTYDERFLIAHTLKSGERCVIYKYNSERVGLALGECDPDRPIYLRPRLTKNFELRIKDKLCLDFGWNPFKLIECHFSGGMQRVRYDSLREVLFDEGYNCLLEENSKEKWLIFGACPIDYPYNWTFETIYHRDMI